MNFNLKERTILLTIAGSRAYGMHTDSSDVDIKGCCIPPEKYRRGFKYHFEQADKPSNMYIFHNCLNNEEKKKASEGELEGSIYEIRKFFKLASDNNPNILDAIFCRNEEVRYITPLGKELRDFAPNFISKKCRWTFGKYAASQLARIETHRKWLLNPPTKALTRSECGLPEYTEIPKDQLLAAESAVKKKVDSWEIDFADLDQATKMYILNQMYKYLAEINITSDTKRSVFNSF